LLLLFGSGSLSRHADFFEVKRDPMEIDAADYPLQRFNDPIEDESRTRKMPTRSLM
jgi:hypothetical protein